MHHRTARRIASLGLAGIFTANVAFAYKPDVSVWEARRKRAAPARQMAALPSAPPALPRAVIDNLPAARLSNTRPPAAAMRGRALRFDLPLAFATLRSVSWTGQAPRRVVVHMQDIHENLEAQSNLSHALRGLAAQPGVAFIAAEGAFEDIRFDDYKGLERATPPVADALLKEGRIAGPLHAALTAPARIPALIGVDDAALHAANVAAFRRAEAAKRTTRKHLDSEQARLDREAAAFSPDLAAFDAAVQAHAAGRTGLAPHLRLLTRGVAVPEPVRNYLAAAELEDALDFERVENERARLLARLAGHLSAAELERLVKDAADYRLGAVSAAAFYARLDALGRARGVGMDGFPVMRAYMRYVAAADRVRPSDVLKAADALEDAQYTRLARTERERRLVAERRRARLNERLSTFSLGPDEWTRWSTGPADARLAAHADFYHQAEARDAAMAERLIARMNASNAAAAVIVAGGFHGDGLRRRLNKAGIGVVAMVPKITKIDAAEGSQYLTAFLREKAPLETLLQRDKLFLAPQVGTDVQFVQAAALSSAEMAIQGWLDAAGAETLFQRLVRNVKTRIGFALTRIDGRRARGRVTNGDRYAEFHWDRDHDGPPRVEWNPVHLAWGAATLAMAIFILKVLTTPGLAPEPVRMGLLILMVYGGAFAAIAAMLSQRGPRGPAFAFAMAGGPERGRSAGDTIRDVIEGLSAVFIVATPSDRGGDDEATRLIRWFNEAFRPALTRAVQRWQNLREVPQNEIQTFIQDVILASEFGARYTAPPMLQPNAPMMAPVPVIQTLTGSVLGQIFNPSGVAIVGGPNGQLSVSRIVATHAQTTASGNTATVQEVGPQKDWARMLGMPTPLGEIVINPGEVIIPETIRGAANGIATAMLSRNSAYNRIRMQWRSRGGIDYPAYDTIVRLALEVSDTKRHIERMGRWMSEGDAIQNGFWLRPQRRVDRLWRGMTVNFQLIRAMQDAEGMFRLAAADPAMALNLLDRLASGQWAADHPLSARLAGDFDAALRARLAPDRSGDPLLAILDRVEQNTAIEAVQAVAREFLNESFYSPEEKRQMIETGQLPTAPSTTSRLRFENLSAPASTPGPLEVDTVVRWVNEHIFPMISAVNDRWRSAQVVPMDELVALIEQRLKDAPFWNTFWRLPLAIRHGEPDLQLGVLTDLLLASVQDQLMIPNGIYIDIANNQFVISRLVRMPDVPALDNHPVLFYQAVAAKDLARMAGMQTPWKNVTIRPDVVIVPMIDPLSPEHIKKAMLQRNSRYHAIRERWRTTHPLDYNPLTISNRFMAEKAAEEAYRKRMERWAPLPRLYSEGFAMKRGSPLDGGSFAAYIQVIYAEATLRLAAHDDSAALNLLDRILSGEISNDGPAIGGMVARILEHIERAAHPHGTGGTSLMQFAEENDLPTVLAAVRRAAAATYEESFWNDDEKRHMEETGHLPPGHTGGDIIEGGNGGAGGGGGNNNGDGTPPNDDEWAAEQARMPDILRMLWRFSASLNPDDLSRPENTPEELWQRFMTAIRGPGGIGQTQGMGRNLQGIPDPNARFLVVMGQFNQFCYIPRGFIALSTDAQGTRIDQFHTYGLARIVDTLPAVHFSPTAFAPDHTLPHYVVDTPPGYTSSGPALIRSQPRGGALGFLYSERNRLRQELMDFQNARPSPSTEDALDKLMRAYTAFQFPAMQILVQHWADMNTASPLVVRFFSEIMPAASVGRPADYAAPWRARLRTGNQEWIRTVLTPFHRFCFPSAPADTTPDRMVDNLVAMSPADMRRNIHRYIDEHLRIPRPRIDAYWTPLATALFAGMQGMPADAATRIARHFAELDHERGIMVSEAPAPVPNETRPPVMLAGGVVPMLLGQLHLLATAPRAESLPADLPAALADGLRAATLGNPEWTSEPSAERRFLMALQWVNANHFIPSGTVIMPPRMLNAPVNAFNDYRMMRIIHRFSPVVVEGRSTPFFVIDDPQNIYTDDRSGAFISDARGAQRASFMVSTRQSIQTMTTYFQRAAERRTGLGAIDHLDIWSLESQLLAYVFGVHLGADDQINMIRSQAMVPGYTRSFAGWLMSFALMSMNPSSRILMDYLFRPFYRRLMSSNENPPETVMWTRFESLLTMAGGPERVEQAYRAFIAEYPAMRSPPLDLAVSIDMLGFITYCLQQAAGGAPAADTLTWVQQTFGETPAEPAHETTTEIPAEINQLYDETFRGFTAPVVAEQTTDVDTTNGHISREMRITLQSWLDTDILPSFNIRIGARVRVAADLGDGVRITYDANDNIMLIELGRARARRTDAATITDTVNLIRDQLAPIVSEASRNQLDRAMGLVTPVIEQIRRNAPGNPLIPALPSMARGPHKPAWDAVRNRVNQAMRTWGRTPGITRGQLIHLLCRAVNEHFLIPREIAILTPTASDNRYMAGRVVMAAGSFGAAGRHFQILYFVDNRGTTTRVHAQAFPSTALLLDEEPMPDEELTPLIETVAERWPDVDRAALSSLASACRNSGFPGDIADLILSGRLEERRLSSGERIWIPVLANAPAPRAILSLLTTDDIVARHMPASTSDEAEILYQAATATFPSQPATIPTITFSGTQGWMSGRMQALLRAWLGEIHPAFPLPMNIIVRNNEKRRDRIHVIYSPEDNAMVIELSTRVAQRTADEDLAFVIKIIQSQIRDTWNASISHHYNTFGSLGNAALTRLNRNQMPVASDYNAITPLLLNNQDQLAWRTAYAALQRIISQWSRTPHATAEMIAIMAIRFINEHFLHQRGFHMVLLSSDEDGRYSVTLTLIRADAGSAAVGTTERRLLYVQSVPKAPSGNHEDDLMAFPVYLNHTVGMFQTADVAGVIAPAEAQWPAGNKVAIARLISAYLLAGASTAELASILGGRLETIEVSGHPMQAPVLANAPPARPFFDMQDAADIVARLAPPLPQRAGNSDEGGDDNGQGNDDDGGQGGDGTPPGDNTPPAAPNPDDFSIYIELLWDASLGDTTLWEGLIASEGYPLTAEQAIDWFFNHPGFQNIRDRQPGPAVLAGLLSAHDFNPTALATARRVADATAAGWMRNWFTDLMAAVANNLSRLADHLATAFPALNAARVREVFLASPVTETLRERIPGDEDLAELITLGDGFSPDAIAAVRGVTPQTAAGWLDSLVGTLFDVSEGNFSRWAALMAARGLPADRAPAAMDYFRASPAMAARRQLRPGMDDLHILLAVAGAEDQGFNVAAIALERGVPEAVALEWLVDIALSFHQSSGRNLPRWADVMTPQGYPPQAVVNAMTFFIHSPHPRLAIARLEQPADEDVLGLIAEFGINNLAVAAQVRNVPLSRVNAWVEQALIRQPAHRGRFTLMAAAVPGLTAADLEAWANATNGVAAVALSFRVARPADDELLGLLLTNDYSAPLPGRDFAWLAAHYEVPLTVVLGWVYDQSRPDVLLFLRSVNPGADTLRAWLMDFMGDLDAICAAHGLLRAELEQWLGPVGLAHAGVLSQIDLQNPDLRTILILLQDQATITDEDRQDILMWLQGHYPHLFVAAAPQPTLRPEVQAVLTGRDARDYGILDGAYQIEEVRLAHQPVQDGAQINSAYEVVPFSVRIRVDEAAHPYLRFTHLYVRGADQVEIRLQAEGNGVYTARGSVILRHRHQGAAHELEFFAVDTTAARSRPVRGPGFNTVVNYTGPGVLSRAQARAHLQFLRDRLITRGADSRALRIQRLQQTVERIMLSDFAPGTAEGFASLDHLLGLARQHLAAAVNQARAQIPHGNALHAELDRVEARFIAEYMNDTPLPAGFAVEAVDPDAALFTALLPHVDAVRILLAIRQKFQTVAATPLPELKAGHQRPFAERAALFELLRRYLSPEKGAMLSTPWDARVTLALAAHLARTEGRTTVVVVDENLMLEWRRALAQLDVTARITDSETPSPAPMENAIEVLDLTSGTLAERGSMIDAAAQAPGPRIIFVTPQFLDKVKPTGSRTASTPRRTARDHVSDDQRTRCWELMQGQMGLLAVAGGHQISGVKESDFSKALRDLVKDGGGRVKPDVMRMGLTVPVAVNGIEPLLSILNFVDRGIIAATVPQGGRERTFDPQNQDHIAALHLIAARAMVLFEPERVLESVPMISTHEVPYTLTFGQMRRLFLLLVNYLREARLSKLFAWEAELAHVFNRPDGDDNPKLDALEAAIDGEFTGAPQAKALVVVRYKEDADRVLERLAGHGALAYAGDGYMRLQRGRDTFFEYDPVEGAFVIDPTTHAPRPVSGSTPAGMGRRMSRLEYNRLRFENDPSIQVLVTTQSQWSDNGDPEVAGITHVIHFDTPRNPHDLQIGAQRQRERTDTTQVRVLRLSARPNAGWFTHTGVFITDLFRAAFFGTLYEEDRHNTVQAVRNLMRQILTLGQPGSPLTAQLIVWLQQQIAHLNASFHPDQEAPADGTDEAVQAAEAEAAVDPDETGDLELTEAEEDLVFEALTGALKTEQSQFAGAFAQVDRAREDAYAELTGLLGSLAAVADETLTPAGITLRTTQEDDTTTEFRLSQTGTRFAVTREQGTGALGVNGAPISAAAAAIPGVDPALFTAIETAIETARTRPDAATLLRNWHLFLFFLRRTAASTPVRTAFLRSVVDNHFATGQLIPIGMIQAAFTVPFAHTRPVNGDEAATRAALAAAMGASTHAAVTATGAAITAAAAASNARDLLGSWRVVFDAMAASPLTPTQRERLLAHLAATRLTPLQIVPSGTTKVPQTTITIDVPATYDTAAALNALTPLSEGDPDSNVVRNVRLRINRAAREAANAGELIDNWQAFMETLQGDARFDAATRRAFLQSAYQTYMRHNMIIPTGALPFTPERFFSYRIMAEEDGDWWSYYLWHLHGVMVPGSPAPDSFATDELAIQHMTNVIVPWFYANLHMVWDWGDIGRLVQRTNHLALDLMHDSGFPRHVRELYERLVAHVISHRSTAHDVIQAPEPPGDGATQALIFALWSPILRWLMAAPRGLWTTRAVLSALAVAEEIIFIALAAVPAVIAATAFGVDGMALRLIASLALLAISFPFGGAHERAVRFDGDRLSVGGRLDAHARTRIGLRGLAYRTPLLIALVFAMPWNAVILAAALALVLHWFDDQVVRPALARRDRRRLETFVREGLAAALSPDEQLWFDRLHGDDINLGVNRLGGPLANLPSAAWARFMADAERRAASLPARGAADWRVDLWNFFAAAPGPDQTPGRTPDADLIVPTARENLADALSLAATLPAGRKLYLWVSPADAAFFAARLGTAKGRVSLVVEPGLTAAGDGWTMTPAAMEAAARRAEAMGAAKGRLGFAVFENFTMDARDGLSPYLRGMPVMMILGRLLLPPVAAQDWDRLQRLALVIAQQA